MTSIANGETDSKESAQNHKIGLALSGGGFRASIFHLGVILRLEERGIMPDVSVISCVSGGSIIAAYYVCEMERRLRTRRKDWEENPVETRVGLFHEIAKDFFRALDHNLRTRAMVFSPFYHPFLWLKSLRPGCSRSDLIREEYDRWFYHGATLDALPAVTDEKATGAVSIYRGPKLVLNATSLLTGERVSFSRVPVDGMAELKKPDKNAIPLSRVVGASSCVPGAMPPTPILGDVLVDGGVSDNQAITGLLENGCNVLLVSDASGQFEAQNEVSASAPSVLLRTSSVLQFEVRNKMIDILLMSADPQLQSEMRGKLLGQSEISGKTQFAFVHLFLNLKDRVKPGKSIPRVPSEYISGLGRIRTDLDQFSYIEREALMYHGYTLIEANMEAHCDYLKQNYASNKAPMRKPALFHAQADNAENRRIVRAELEVGQYTSLIFRNLRKDQIAAENEKSPVRRFLKGYLGYMGRRIGLAVLLFAVLAFSVCFYGSDFIESCIAPHVSDVVSGIVPAWLEYIPWPLAMNETATLLVLALLAYVEAFFLYMHLRPSIAARNKRTYVALAGKEVPGAWKSSEVRQAEGENE